MGFRFSPEAEAELDDIWFYVARESGSTEIAGRLIDAITDRFWLLRKTRKLEDAAMPICGLACAVFPWANTSSSTESKTTTRSFSM